MKKVLLFLGIILVSSIIFMAQKCTTTPIEASCQDILTNGKGTVDGVYTIDPDGAQGPTAPFQVYCDMTTDGGGWTLLLKAVGDSTFHYEDARWTNGEVLNEQSLDLSAVNAKYLSFSTVKAMELRATFPTEGNYRYIINLGSQLTALEVFQGPPIKLGYGNQWNPNWSTQPNCQTFGTNTPYCYQRARFGFTANQENDCNTNDTAAGLGLGPYCTTNEASKRGAGNLCLSSNCSKGTVNRGFLGLLWAR